MLQSCQTGCFNFFALRLSSPSGKHLCGRPHPNANGRISTYGLNFSKSLLGLFMNHTISLSFHSKSLYLNTDVAVETSPACPCMKIPILPFCFITLFFRLPCCLVPYF